MTELFNLLWQLVVVLGKLVVEFLSLILQSSLLMTWVAWWVWGVDWRKTWRALAAGAWMPVLLLMVVSALVWSRIAPSDCTCLGFTTVPNFWWQLGAVGLLGALTLFCGWLQGLMGWTPTEISLEPPAAHHQHQHKHGHGQGHSHH